MSDTPVKPARPLWRRLWPVYVIAAGLAAGWKFGLFDYFSLETLREQHETLRSLVENNLLLAVAAYILVYALATLFMVPGALWITIAGGFLFGLAGGSAATTVGATLGASFLFFAARSAFGGILRERAGPFLRKMEAGFHENPRSYMFALRFLPLVPFPVANIAPALLGAKYPDYALTTAIGIIPGVIAYTWIGAGLGATFAAGENPDIASVAGNLVPAFAALAVVSLMPVVWKKTFGRKAPQIESPSA
ncbi:MAG TPA: VTT domain-containing protein [Hyphomonas sp.]|nr:TVP38/TMEM64 family protein [Hyphomonas sp.]HPE48071.1 VTT domain-containing protein [Hyphomonas sp.]